MSAPPASGSAGPAGPPARPAPPRPLALVRGAIRAVLGALILVGLAINFANVVGRYVFLKPIIWAEEVLVFMMIWCVMLGAALVTWQDGHLRMDAVYHMMPPRARRWLDVLSTLAFLFAGVFLLVQSVRVLAVVAGTGQRSVVAEIPMAIPYGAMPLSFGVIVAVLVGRVRASGGAGSRRAAAPGEDG